MDKQETLEALILNEAPQLYQETLSWGMVDSIVGVLFFSLLLLALIPIYRHSKPNCNEPEDLTFLRVLIAILSAFLSGILICIILNIIQIYIAPHTYVVQTLMGQ